MLQLSTSAGRDGWLTALIAAFDSASTRALPVTAQMMAETERHLLANAQVRSAGSHLLH